MLCVTICERFLVLVLSVWWNSCVWCTYIYICSYAKTPTVNWCRGLYTSIYIVCVHAFYQGLVWCPHCSLLWTYAMRTLKYMCARLRLFETHKYYSTWAILLLPCHTQALTVCSKGKMQAPCTHMCKLRRELYCIIILCIYWYTIRINNFILDIFCKKSPNERWCTVQLSITNQ